MGRTNNERNVEHRPKFEDAELRFPDEDWNTDQSNDMSTYHKRRTVGLWTAIASLAVVLAVMAGYGYSVISKHNTELTRLSDRLTSFASIRTQTNKLEASLNGWETRQKGLATHVQKLDKGIKSDLRNLRLGTADLVAKAVQKEHRALNQRTANLNAEIAEMISLRQADRVHMAKLESEFVNTRHELISARRTYAREIAALERHQIVSQREISSLNNQLSREQIDFKAAKNQSEEIAPGISLRLTHTDTTHQRFQGRIKLRGSKHQIWVHANPIERPVVFYAKPGGAPYQLVVTQVNRKEVAGYLLVPRNAARQQADVASASKSVTSASTEASGRW